MNKANQKLRSRTPVAQKQLVILAVVLVVLITFVAIYFNQKGVVGKAVSVDASWGGNDINLTADGSVTITSLPAGVLELHILTNNSNEEQNYSFSLERRGELTYQFTIVLASEPDRHIAEDIIYTGGDDRTTIYLDPVDSTPDLEVSYHNGQIIIRNLHFPLPPPVLCGNGIIDGGELCDSANLNSQTCQTQQFASGTLACNSNCTFNTGRCVAAPPSPLPIPFHRFHGQVTGLPEGTFTLRAKVGGVTLNSTSLDNAGSFDFSINTTGTPSVVFYVVHNDQEVPVGSSRYQNGGTTELGFQYTAPPVTPPTNQTSNATTPARNQTQATTNQTIPTNVTNRTATGNCTQSWECGDWSLCRNSQQTRVCYRSDTCDQQLSQGRIGTVLPITKPTEQRTCQEPAATAPTQYCSPGSKRCLGSELQQCVADGSQWQTQTTCPNGCSSLTFECKPEITAPPVQQQPSSNWIYYLIGSLVLLGVIATVIIVIINQRKFAPAKEYIEESRVEGISDQQIKTRLLSQGWEAQKVHQFLRK